MTVDRQLVKQVVSERRRSSYGECSYCGTPCYGGVCADHRDLPQIEHQLTVSNEPSRTPHKDPRPGSSTKGA